MHHIIFDMDGVLSDSWEADIECLYKLRFYADTREETMRRNAAYSSRKPDHARGQGFSEKEYKERLLKVQEFSRCMLTMSVPLFSKFIESIKSIQDTRMAVVSSNCSAHVKDAAQRTGLPFTHVLTFDDSPSKEDKVESICNDWGIPVSDVIYVTDTLADVYELETIMPKSHIIGCAWGYCGYAALRTELSKGQILREPDDIIHVISSFRKNSYV